ncbi:MAG: TRAP transporter fused permease subunit [Syntrophorhabdaceae bacterium]|nr:TRAP transporter fused permease subunit [Syntrophorhabdaceae bacterium]
MVDGKSRATDSPIVNTIMKICGILLTLGSIGWAVDIYSIMGLKIYNEQFIACMLALAMALAFLHFPPKGDKKRTHIPWYDKVAAALSFGACLYLAIRYPVLVDLVLLKPPEAVIIGVLVILLGLEALRRATGNVLLTIVILFILYALFGDIFPGQLAGRPQEWQKLAAYLAFDVNAMLGTPLRVATTIVITFVLFGNLLSVTGGSSFFTEAALITMGRFRGGSAKIAVVASMLFGSISGSAVANVVATGVVTIPMIKKSGYPAYKAGAIEAVASTGGQLMPPVMGAAAFLMAEFLQIPYSKVALAALVPSILYYAALFIEADLEAAKAGITRVPKEMIPSARTVLGGLHFLTCFVVLLLALFYYNLQPETAVLLSCVTILVFSYAFGYKGKRPDIVKILASFYETGISVIEIMVICLAAGLVIGMLSVSGLGFNLTMLLVWIGGNNLFLLLLLSAVVCIILGMGMPTIGVYVLLAALVAPAMIKIGINPIAAHLYVMYYGMMSMITPPVAIAAYAAASLAQADAMRTGWEAVRFGWSAFIVPFLFVCSPTLILIGNPISVLFAVVTAGLGIWFASIGMVGYFLRNISIPRRILFFIMGILALIPAEAFKGAVYTDIVGVLGGASLIIWEFIVTKAKRKPAP